jgi:IclR family acetate operon transcriptional repressor
VPPKSVLGRALTLLTAFRPGDAELTLAELARRTGLPKPTAHRMLAELAEWNVVERTPHGIRLGMRLFELGQLAPLQRGLREAAAPFLSDLFEATHETVHLAVPDGLDVVYVQKLPGRHGPQISSRIGGRMPVYCTGVGKAMLAFAPPERLAAVVAAGLARRTPRTVVAPGLLAEELARIRERGWPRSTRSRRSGSRASRPRCATAARTPSRRSRSPGGPTGSTPPASRPPSARPRWGCRASCVQAPDPAQAPDPPRRNLARAGWARWDAGGG